MKNKKYIFVSLFLIFSTIIFSQIEENEENGVSKRAEFNSSTLDTVAGFVGGSHIRFPYELPSYLIINPAIYNSLNVPLMELSYGGIIETGDMGSGYSGHRMSTWINIPIASGQINSGIEIQHLDTSLASTGTFSRIHFGWANKVRGNFVLGLGFEAGLASGQEMPSWGLSAKFGVSQNLGRLGPFSNFTWAAALTNLGKEIETMGNSYYRSPFTLRSNAHAEINVSENFQLHNSLSLDFPGFTDLLLTLQLSTVFFKSFSLSLSWGFDLVQLINKDYQNASLLPRIGISYSLLGLKNPDLDSSLAIYSPYQDHTGFALGTVFPFKKIDRDGPKIQLEIPETIHISPNNDGVQDSWSGELSVTDQSEIARMELHISEGITEVFSQVWELEPVRNTGLSGFIQEVFRGSKTVSIPESILITGKDENGKTLPDGSYEISLHVDDVLGNRTSLPLSKLLIDNNAPRIFLVIAGEEASFSPNGDGNKDTLIIDQNGSREEQWDIKIFNSSNEVVWSRELKDRAPSSIEWNGYDNFGNRLADGIYHYQISSRDQAGNQNSARVTNIIVNSTVSPVKFSLTDSHFSPNNDGVKDEIIFQVEPEDPFGVKQWTVEILDEEEKVHNTLAGTGSPPSEVIFNGVVQEQDSLLPEGRYRARLTVEYSSGNRPQALSPWFILDLTPPEITVNLLSRLFSPNNDGRDDEIQIYQQSSDESLWKGSIIETSNAQKIKNFTFRGSINEKIIWDGRDDTGVLAPDGRYIYEISSTDDAGNLTLLQSEEFSLDTASTEVLVSAVHNYFSPNGDQILEEQEFITRVLNNEQVASFSFEIMTIQEQLIQRVDGTGPVSKSVYWDGKSLSGKQVPDGEYFAKLRVELMNKSIGESQTRSFVIDTEYPKVRIDSDYLIFSPNGDNKRDILPIHQLGSGEESYSAVVYNAAGESVRDYFWTDSLDSFNWDGRDHFDNPVPDGSYRYLLQVEDRARNLTEAEIADIVVDRRNISIFLTLNETGISPNNDGFKDELQINLVTNVTDGIDYWTLGVYTESNRLIWEQTGSDLDNQSSFIFDGRNETGAILEGKFYTQFDVYYTKGDSPTARSPLFTIDTTGPELQVILDPLPFSPDGDGFADVLTIDLSSGDPSGINGWQFIILDRVENVFQTFGSQEAPEERIYWDGLSASGDRVISAEDYLYTFEVRDSLGNSSVRNGLIPIDILVICTQDKSECKIQIANINFEPNSPELILGRSEVGRKNNEIINKLAELFTKYSQYSITIEGHANNISQTEREEKEELLPLSTGRAESVKSALISLGMEPERILIEGKGGGNPLVSFSDLKNRWKNRRVEFILNK